MKLFMSYHENNWLEDYEGIKPILYKRYVDDIFAAFENENDLVSFFDYLNNRHPNKKFTKEDNIDGNIGFLDIFISSKNSFSTSLYHKPTFTGLYLNFKSFAPMQFKTMLVNTLLDRIFKISSNWVNFHLDVEQLSKYLMKNLYPKKLIDKLCKKFLDKNLLIVMF